MPNCFQNWPFWKKSQKKFKLNLKVKSIKIFVKENYNIYFYLGSNKAKQHKWNYTFEYQLVV